MQHSSRRPSTPITAPYSYQPRRPGIAPPVQRRRIPRSRLRFLPLFILLAALGFWGIGSQIIRAATTKPPMFSTALATQIGDVITNNPDDHLSVSLIDNQTGETARYGSTTVYDAASTAKLITACAYYHLVEQGKASLDAPLGYYDAQFNLKSMINDSNNDAWHLLTNVIGLDTLHHYASSIGLHYNTADNTLTSSDMALLLNKLYTGKLLSNAHTSQLLSYMQNTNDETLIPAALPSDITVYHKYGLLDGNLHDASIIIKGGHTYSFVIYTKNTDDSDDDARTTVIHQLTQIVTKQLFNE